MREAAGGGVRGVADAIHEQMCGMRKPPGAGCVAYRRGSGSHWEFYQEKAGAVWAALEPEIGSANAEFAVRVILEELL